MLFSREFISLNLLQKKGRYTVLSRTKEVDFHKYCPKCEHFKEDEFDAKSICYDCLAEGHNVDSHKPVSFKEKRDD